MNSRVYAELGLPPEKVDELFELLKLIRRNAGDFPDST
jgi:hypothetical protein